MTDIHARTSAAFLADAAARCARLSSEPVEPVEAGAADAAIAAIEAGLVEAGAIKAPLSAEGRDAAWRASRPDTGGALAAIRPAIDSGEAWPSKAPIRDAYAPAPWPAGIVPQQVQQQQARDARHAQGILSPGCIPDRVMRRGMARCDGPGLWQIGIYTVERRADGKWISSATGPGTFDGGGCVAHPCLASAYRYVTGENMPGAR